MKKELVVKFIASMAAIALTIALWLFVKEERALWASQKEVNTMFYNALIQYGVIRDQ